MSFAGKLFYHFVYKPKASLDKIARTGWRKHKKIIKANKEMIKASQQLSEVYRPNLPEQKVYFLTGKNHFYQTAFCLYSLQKACNTMQINAVFIDDGTADISLKKQVKNQYPHSSFVFSEETEYRLNKLLPEAKYPALRKRRLIYPHLKKLTDIHTLPGNWKLVLDSDMLFFSEPNEVIHWMNEQQHPIVLEDMETAYGYNTGLMQSLTGCTIPEKINVGLLGINSEAIDWNKLEYWLNQLQKTKGDHYYQEQALTAMILSGMNPQILNKDRYRVFPEIADIQSRKAILHHYVAQSKNDYYLKMWKKTL